MLKSLMPPNHRCIKNKWVFKIKCNGVYQMHFVACGYSQIPGVDFSKNYALEVNQITFHFLFLMVIHFGCSAKIDNLETIFLYGYLEEEIYIECPQGMSDIGKNDCIILNNISTALFKQQDSNKKSYQNFKEFRACRRQC